MVESSPRSFAQLSVCSDSGCICPATVWALDSVISRPMESGNFRSLVVVSNLRPLGHFPPIIHTSAPEAVAPIQKMSLAPLDSTSSTGVLHDTSEL